jgi:ribose 5-phosphate isomerase A
VTDSGNFVVDADFGVLESSAVGELNVKLTAIVGVVETGLFVGMAQKAYFGNAEGKVTSR